MAYDETLYTRNPKTGRYTPAARWYDREVLGEGQWFVFNKPGSNLLIRTVSESPAQGETAVLLAEQYIHFALRDLFASRRSVSNTDIIDAVLNGLRAHSRDPATKL